MRAAFLAFAVLLLAHQASAASPKVPLLRKGPYAIAHRGLSGVFPEHTVKAYQAAIDAGADFIECDVVSTKDCKLICRHEPEIGLTTNAPELFPNLVKTVLIDGYNYTGVFAYDLTLAQIKTLTTKQQNLMRDQSFNGKYRVPTLEEYIAVAQGAKRVVGIYPETKHPTFHDDLQLSCFKGKSLTQAVVEKLTAAGYTGAVGTQKWLQRPAFLQSFERKNLLEVAKLTKIPKVFLTDLFSVAIPMEGNTTYAEVINDPKAMAQLKAAGVAGIGPWKNNLVGYTADNHVDFSTVANGIKIVKKLHAAGFQVHIYTLRNEPKRPDGSGYLPWDFQQDAYLEYDMFFKRIGVDGAFSDQVHTLARYMKKN